MKGLKDFFRREWLGFPRLIPITQKREIKGLYIGNVILRVFDDMTRRTILRSGQIFV